MSEAASCTNQDLPEASPQVECERNISLFKPERTTMIKIHFGISFFFQMTRKLITYTLFTIYQAKERTGGACSSQGAVLEQATLN